MDIVTGPIHVTTALAYEHRRDIERDLDRAEAWRSLDQGRTPGWVSRTIRAAIAPVVMRLAAARRRLGGLTSEIAPWPGALAKPPIVVVADKRRRGRRTVRAAQARRAGSRRAAA
jgi:hypothetical protein